jgi:hypothetical protein
MADAIGRPEEYVAGCVAAARPCQAGKRALASSRDAQLLLLHRLGARLAVAVGDRVQRLAEEAGAQVAEHAHVKAQRGARLA